MAKKDDYLTIRIDKASKEKLRKLADRNKRTLSGQILYMIAKTK